MASRECDLCVEPATRHCVDHELHACPACWAKHCAAEHAPDQTGVAEMVDDLRQVLKTSHNAFTTWDAEFISSISRRVASGGTLSTKQLAMLQRLWDAHCGG